MLGDVNVIVLIMNGAVEKELVKMYSIIFFFLFSSCIYNFVSSFSFAFLFFFLNYLFIFLMVRLIISYYILYNKIDFIIRSCAKQLHQIAEIFLDLKNIYIYIYIIFLLLQYIKICSFVHRSIANPINSNNIIATII